MENDKKFPYLSECSFLIVEPEDMVIREQTYRWWVSEFRLENRSRKLFVTISLGSWFKIEICTGVEWKIFFDLAPVLLQTKVFYVPCLQGLFERLQQYFSEMPRNHWVSICCPGLGQAETTTCKVYFKQVIFIVIQNSLMLIVLMGVGLIKIGVV